MFEKLLTEHDAPRQSRTIRLDSLFLITATSTKALPPQLSFNVPRLLFARDFEMLYSSCDYQQEQHV